jgi:hypothetical protein
LEIEQVAELRKLAEELGIAERVIFHDYIPNEWLADYYRAAGVFALRSRAATNTVQLGMSVKIRGLVPGSETTFYLYRKAKRTTLTKDFPSTAFWEKADRCEGRGQGTS